MPDILAPNGPPVQVQSMSQLLRAEQIVTALGGWTDQPGPRYLQLAAALEDLLGRGSPTDGTRLPSERDVARRLALSRGTVVAAYEQLADRGLVTRRQGSGTRVVGAAAPERPAFHAYPQLTRLITETTEQIDLTFGAPYLDELVADLSAGALGTLAAGAPTHGYAPLGLPPLRAAIAERAGAPAEHILGTNGDQGALALITAALVRPGARVIVQAPTYPGAIELFSRAGAAIVALGRDHAGPRPEELRRALSSVGAALVY